MLTLGECDVALAGGVSESIRAYGIFAGFKSQGALASNPILKKQADHLTKEETVSL